MIYELVLEDLETIRQRTREAIAAGLSPMSVGFCRVVMVDKRISNMDRFTRTLWRDL